MRLPDGTEIKHFAANQISWSWAKHLQANGADVISAGRGDPTFPANFVALGAMRDVTIKEQQEALIDGKPVQYGKIRGETEYLERAARALSSQYSHVLTFDPANLAFVQGGKSGLAAVFAAIEKLKPGSVIISQHPGYIYHQELADMFRDAGMSLGRALETKMASINILDKPGFRLSAQDIDSKIIEVKKNGRKIGAVIVTDPSNPFGVKLSFDELREYADVFRKHEDITIILDESFSAIVFDGRLANRQFRDAQTWEGLGVSLLEVAPDLKDRIALLRSGTKDLGMAGERPAIMMVPEYLLEGFMEYHSIIGTTPSPVHQAGMTAGLEALHPSLKKHTAWHYMERSMPVFEAVKAMGAMPDTIYRPQGTFFVPAYFGDLYGIQLPQGAKDALGSHNTSGIVDSDLSLMMGMMFGMNVHVNAGVALIPISGETDSRTGWMRIYTGNDLETNKKLTDRLGDYIEAARRTGLAGRIGPEHPHGRPMAL